MNRRPSAMGAAVAVVMLGAGALVCAALWLNLSNPSARVPAPGRACNAVTDTTALYEGTHYVCALDGTGNGYRWRVG